MEITKKEIVQILKRNKWMGKAHILDEYIKDIYLETSNKRYIEFYKGGFVSFFKHQIENYLAHNETPEYRMKIILDVNYDYAKRHHEQKQHTNSRNVR